MTIPAHETVGHEMPVWETHVDAARQGRYHRAAGVDGALFGGTVDVSVLANDCLLGARPREALGAKRLHVGVRVEQRAPLALGEPLSVRAEVTSITPDRRGRYILIDFRFQRPDGSVPVAIGHRSLILDPVPAAAPPAAAKTASDTAPASGFEPCGRVQLTPAMVSGYSFEFPHLTAHHDPEAAAAIGMRAPIAQGLMGFTLLFQALMRAGGADTFDVEARFKRPIFWDDALNLEMAPGQLLRARNAAGKTVSELVIHDWN